MPNYLDLDRWIVPPDAKESKHLTVGLCGGNSHVEDWRVVEDVLPRIAEAFPSVHFMFIGYHPDYLLDKLPSDRVQTIGWIQYLYYPWAIAQLDIRLCPLSLEIEFNKYKSDIAFKEAGVLGIPTIATDIEPYRTMRHRKDGFLVEDNDPEKWYAYIAALIKDKKLRKRTGKAARKKACQLSLQQRTRKIAKMYDKIWRDFQVKQGAYQTDSKLWVATRPVPFARVNTPVTDVISA